MKMTLGNVLECLPDFMLRRLAKADGGWSSETVFREIWQDVDLVTERYNVCFVGRAAGLLMDHRNRAGSMVPEGRGYDEANPEVAYLRAISGPDPYQAEPGGAAVRQYLSLCIRFGDQRIGRAIEQRANKILADRATEADLASVEVEGECVVVGGRTEWVRP